MSTVVLVATTSRFYTEGSWSESIMAALELAGALRFDFSFNLAFTIGWPKLPGLPAIHFAAAVGVLLFHFVVTNFFRIYYGSGADTAGTATIQHAFDAAHCSGEYSSNRSVHNSITSAHAALATGLSTAILIDLTVAKIEASRQFTVDEAKFIEAKKTSVSLEAPADSENKLRLQGVVKELRKELEMQKAKNEEAVKDAATHAHGATKAIEDALARARFELKSLPQSVRDLEASHFERMLVVDAVTGRFKKTYKGVYVLSVTASDVSKRKTVATFLLGDEGAWEDTSRILQVLSELNFPDVEQLIFHDRSVTFDVMLLSKFHGLKTLSFPGYSNITGARSWLVAHLYGVMIILLVLYRAVHLLVICSSFSSVLPTRCIHC